MCFQGSEADQWEHAKTVADSGGEVGTKSAGDTLQLSSSPEEGSTEQQCDNSPPGSTTDLTKQELRRLTSRKLHKKLSEVDPESAKRIHPHDMRKVER